jgi:hypothetical protein
MRIGTALLSMLLVAPMVAIAQEEPSLADRAAALRHANGKAIDPEVAGRVVRNDYVNDYFGLTIRHLNGWESLSAGQMNVNEAVGRDAMGLKAGVDSSSGRVFGMHDLLGSSVYVSVRPIPPGTDLSGLGAKLRTAVTKEVANLKCADEQATIGDANHHFVAFRCINHAADQEFYQGEQAIVVRGHLMVLTLTTPTQEKMTALVRQLRASLQWRGQPQ